MGRVRRGGEQARGGSGISRRLRRARATRRRPRQEAAGYRGQRLFKEGDAFRDDVERGRPRSGLNALTIRGYLDNAGRCNLRES
jgi:hypothetical protein